MFPFEPQHPQYYPGYYNPYSQSTRPSSAYDPFTPFASHRRASPHPAPTFDAFLEPDSDESMVDPNSYRRLAFEHQRRVEVALALAQEQEQRNRELQRQLALDRLRAELGHAPGVNVHARRDDSPSRQPRSHAPHSHRHPAEMFSTAAETPRHGGLEDEIRGFLRRREQERDHVQKAGAHPHRQEAMHPAQTSVNRTPQSAVVVPTASHDGARTPVRLQPEEPAPTDLATRLRNALSSGRSKEEKDNILRELGVMTVEKPQHSAVEREKTQDEVSPQTVAINIQESSQPQTPMPTATETQSSPTKKVSSQSLASIDGIQTQFDALRTDFTFPPAVEFAPPTTTTTSSDDTATPKLLYNRTNAVVLHYESELIKLLTRLDAIDSAGAESVRGARRALVLAIERELDELEGMKREAWSRVRGEKVTSTAVDGGAVDVVAIEVEDPAAVASGPVEDASDLDPHPATEASESEDRQPSKDSELSVTEHSSTLDGQPLAAPGQGGQATSPVEDPTQVNNHQETSPASDNAPAEEAASHSGSADDDEATIRVRDGDNHCWVPVEVQ